MIQDMRLKSTYGMSPRVHEARLRTTMIEISHIKKFEDECTNICKESEKVQEYLMGDPKIKVVEAKL
jgi:hypothetical protein